MKAIYVDKHIPRLLLVKALKRLWPDVVFSPLSPACASDIALLMAEAAPTIAPAALPGTRRFYLGHEVVGEVIEVGAGVQHLHVGDRVIMDTRFQGATCLSQEIEPRCRHCAEGNFTGGWGDTFTAHETEVYRVSDDLSDEQAMFVEPLSTAVRAVLRRPPQPRELGADTVLLREDPFDVVATLTGAQVYRGMFGNRMALGGWDVVYDCVGSALTVRDSLRLARGRGTVVMVGITLAPLHVDLTPVWYQEVDLIGVYAHGAECWHGEQRRTYEVVIDLLRAGKLTTDGLITHRFRLDEWRQAIQTAMDKRSGSIKVVFDYT